MTRGAAGIGLVLALGCATTNAPPPRESERVVASTTNGNVIRTNNDAIDQVSLDMTPDSAFTAISAAYVKLKIPVTTSDPVHHVVGNPRFPVSHTLLGKNLSMFLDCGAGTMGMPRADSYHVTISIISTLSAEGSGSVIETAVSAQANDPALGATTMYCSSTGRLEKALLRAAGVSRAE